MHTVLVIGGGYAGVMAANRLAAAPGNASGGTKKTRVTMITQSPDFVERIRLHELAAGSAASVSRSLTSMLHPDVKVIVSRVLSIDTDASLANYEGEDSETQQFSYDYLVYAVGSGNARDDELSTGTLEGAERVRTEIAALRAGTTRIVEVVGGGLTGIETSAEIAAQHPSLEVRLVTRGRIAPSVSVHARNRLLKSLHRLGVATHESIENETAIPRQSADLTVNCTGFQIPTLARDSGLPVDDSNRLLVDASLRLMGSPTNVSNIFGAGDAARVVDPGYEFMRPGCATALPMGAHAADEILRSINNLSPHTHSAGYVFQCISLGRRRGVVQFVRSNDAPKSLVLSGALGAWVKEWICTQTVAWPLGESRKGGSYSWPAGPQKSAVFPTAPALR